MIVLARLLIAESQVVVVELVVARLQIALALRVEGEHVTIGVGHVRQTRSGRFIYSAISCACG